MYKKILHRYNSISDGPKKVLHNMNWLFWDNVIRMGVSFFVSIAIARYFGPEKYGIFNYSIAFVFLFSFLSSLGLDNIAIRELINNPDKNKDILGSVLILKLTGSILAIILLNIVSFFLHGANSEFRILILILSFGFIFQVSSVYSIYYISRVEGKFNVIATGIGFILSNFLKILVIFFSKGIIYLAFITLFESFINLLCYVFIFRYYGGSNILSFNLNKSIIKKYFIEGLPFSLISISSLIYGRIDQIIIGNMLGSKEVGLYSIAVSLSESPIFLSTVIGYSIYPAIIASKNIGLDTYKERLKLVFSLMSLISIIIVICVSIFSSEIIIVLFGTSYADSIYILKIYIWTLIMVFFSVIFGYYLVIEKKVKFTLYGIIFGCILNIIANLILIPKFGLEGAAYATVFPSWISLLIFFIFKDTRQLIIFSIYSFNPFHILKYGIKNLIIR